LLFPLMKVRWKSIFSSNLLILCDRQLKNLRRLINLNTCSTFLWTFDRGYHGCIWVHYGTWAENELKKYAKPQEKALPSASLHFCCIPYFSSIPNTWPCITESLLLNY
jgi:hypothetical protein